MANRIPESLNDEKSLPLYTNDLALPPVLQQTLHQGVMVLIKIDHGEKREQIICSGLAFVHLPNYCVTILHRPPSCRKGSNHNLGRNRCWV